MKFLGLLVIFTFNFSFAESQDLENDPLLAPERKDSTIIIFEPGPQNKEDLVDLSNSTPTGRISKEENEKFRQEAFDEIDIEEVVLEEPKKRRSWLSKEWQRLDKNIPIKVKFNLGPLEISGRYKYGVEAAFEEGKYLRRDIWRTKNVIDAGTFFDIFDGDPEADVQLPINPFKLGMEKNSQIGYYRLFDTEKQAFTAGPYTPFPLPTGNVFGLPSVPSRAPFSSKVFLERMAVGDFVSMQSVMNWFAGFNGSMKDGVFKYSAKLLRIIRGNFLLHFYVMPNNHLRLKIYTGASKGVEAGFSAELSFTAVDVDEVNDLIVDLVDDRIIMYEKENIEGEILALDFIFDLNDKTARDALDNFLSPKLLIKNSKLSAKVFYRDITFSGKDEGPDKLTMALSDLDGIFRIVNEDFYLKQGHRIKRVFKGYNRYKTSCDNKGFSILLGEFSAENCRIINDIVTFEGKRSDGSDNKKYYFVPSFTKKVKGKLDLGIFERKSSVFESMFAIFDKEQNVGRLDFTHFGLSFDEYFASLNQERQKNWIKMLRANLPKGAFESINWDQWGWSGVHDTDLDKCARPKRLIERLPFIDFNCDADLFKKTNARVYFQFFVNPTGIRRISNLRRDQYIKRIKTLASTFAFEGKDIEEAERKAEKLGAFLFEGFSNWSTLEIDKKIDRLQDFQSGNRFKKFRRFFPAIVRALLQEPIPNNEEMAEEIKKYNNRVYDESVFFYLEAFATDIDEIKYSAGMDSRDLFNQIQGIDNALNQDDVQAFIFFRRDE